VFCSRVRCPVRQTSRDPIGLNGYIERENHIALPEDVHQRLQIKCEIEDASMQKFISTLIAEALRGIRAPAPIARGNNEKTK